MYTANGNKDTVTPRDTVNEFVRNLLETVLRDDEITCQYLQAERILRVRGHFQHTEQQAATLGILLTDACGWFIENYLQPQPEPQMGQDKFVGGHPEEAQDRWESLEYNLLSNNLVDLTLIASPRYAGQLYARRAAQLFGHMSESVRGCSAFVDVQVLIDKSWGELCLSDELMRELRERFDGWVLEYKPPVDEGPGRAYQPAHFELQLA